MDENKLNESSFRRARHDFVGFYHRILFFGLVEILMMSVGVFIGSLLIPDQSSDIVTAGLPTAGAIIGAIIGMAIIFIVCLFRAPYNQRNEARIALISIPGATPNSPRVASPELFFEDIDCKFIGDNPPLLLIKWGVMPTGSMHLEQAKIEILGGSIPFTDWETCDVSPTISFMFANQCKIMGGLPTGNHDIRIQVLANRIWWASDWQTITYSPSVPDKEGSQT